MKSRLEQLQDRLTRLHNHIDDELKLDKPAQSYLEDLKSSIVSIETQINYIERTGHDRVQMVNGY